MIVDKSGDVFTTEKIEGQTEEQKYSRLYLAKLKKKEDAQKKVNATIENLTTKKLQQKVYSKEYYVKNKDKIIEQTVDKWKNNSNRISKTRESILTKLNENKYKRIPHQTIKNYNISYDSETHKYTYI